MDCAQHRGPAQGARVGSEFTSTSTPLRRAWHCGVHGAGLDHGRKNNRLANPAAKDRRAGQVGDLFDIPRAIEPIHVVPLEGRVGRKIQPILRWNRSHGPGLLVPRQHNIHRAKIAGSAQHFALGAFISCQDPKAIAPTVVNNVVHVPYAARRKRVGDLPRASAIGRNVDVNFRALAIVEILAPVNSSRGNGRDVQRPCAALNAMRYAKLIAIRSPGHERARNRTHHRLVVCLPVENGQRVKAVAHQAISQRAVRREIPPPDGMKACDRLPLRARADLWANVQANDLISAARVENIAVPREHSNAAPGSDFPKL